MHRCSPLDGCAIHVRALELQIAFELTILHLSTIQNPLLAGVGVKWGRAPGDCQLARATGFQSKFRSRGILLSMSWLGDRSFLKGVAAKVCVAAWLSIPD